MLKKFSSYVRKKECSIRKTEQLLLYRTITAVYRDGHMQHVNCRTKIHIL